MIRVLVTGANGFVGRRLCQVLMELGYEVREALRQACPNGGASPRQFIVGDINSGTQWQEALLDIDCVIHLAARVHVMNETLTDPLIEFREVNKAGTLRLSEQAVTAGVRRFIYLSTIKVNGEETPLGYPFTEDDNKFDSQDAYALSKWEAEKGLFECAKRTGLEVVVIRPPLVYGPGVKANFRRMIEWVNKGVPLPLGAVHNKRSLVALDNLVDLIVTCIEHSTAVDQVFLAGDGVDVSTTELLQGLGVALGTPVRLVSVPQRVLETCLKMLGKGRVAQRLCGSLQVDIRKARELLGWIPPVSVDEGLKKTADWYKRHE